MATKAVFTLDPNGFPTQVKLVWNAASRWIGAMLYSYSTPMRRGEQTGLGLDDRHFDDIFRKLRYAVGEIEAEDQYGQVLTDYWYRIALAEYEAGTLVFGFTTETQQETGEVKVLETVIYFHRVKGVTHETLSL